MYFWVQISSASLVVGEMGVSCQHEVYNEWNLFPVAMQSILTFLPNFRMRFSFAMLLKFPQLGIQKYHSIHEFSY